LPLFLLLALPLWAFQDQVPAPRPEPPSREEILQQLLPQARQAFLESAFERTIEILEPGIRQGIGEALLLAADANYAIDTPESLEQARQLYERCLYEDTSIPFPDHSYFQLGQIFLDKLERAGRDNASEDMRFFKEEASFYLGQLIRKYPGSYYGEQALLQLYELARLTRDFDKMRELAGNIWDTAQDVNNLLVAEPYAYIELDPIPQDLTELRDVYRRHSNAIRFHPYLLLKYAERFEQLGDAQEAVLRYQETVNLYGDIDEGAQGLLKLADLHRTLGQGDAAAFLYGRLVDRDPYSREAAETMLRVARMMEAGEATSFSAAGQEWSYADLVERIRNSNLPEDIRAAYSFRVAQQQALVGSVEKALLILRSLQQEYETGAFAGLYRSFYVALLFATVESYYNQGRDWDLHRIYEDHLQVLAFTPQARFPHLVAKAYKRMDLPASALDVYERMWRYKQSVSGFDLAYETPLTDSLQLLNDLRRDDQLRFRILDYEKLYSARDLQWERFNYIKTIYESRTAPDPAEYVRTFREDPIQIDTIWDARRLRRIAVMAQEEGELDIADSHYEEAKRWPQTRQELPILWREAELYQTDRTYMLGNYFEAANRYRTILNDETYNDDDRDWAYLQLARLFELDGQERQSLRIYGQIAYAEDPNSSAYASFARIRLSNMAHQKVLAAKEREYFGRPF
jgi:hypothetical protein